MSSNKSSVTHLPSLYRRTTAISGSRPSANHTARFYRESAALLCSALP
jgi:hypothetical protein